jgi:hypothetical protein
MTDDSRLRDCRADRFASATAIRKASAGPVETASEASLRKQRGRLALRDGVLPPWKTRCGDFATRCGGQNPPLQPKRNGIVPTARSVAPMCS